VVKEAGVKLFVSLANVTPLKGMFDIVALLPSEFTILKLSKFIVFYEAKLTPKLYLLF